MSDQDTKPKHCGCEKHPKYKGNRKPNRDCQTCNNLWEEKKKKGKKQHYGCEKHPRYRGGKKPNRECETCHRLWEEKKKKEKTEPNQAIELKCNEHTRYRGKGKPTSGCDTCWEIHLEYEIQLKSAIEKDIHEYQQKEATRKEKAKYRQVLKENEEAKKTLVMMLNLKENSEKAKRLPIHFVRSMGKLDSVVPIAVLSDVHYEQEVKQAQIEGLKNEYNLEIAEKRLRCFFKNTLKLAQGQYGVKIEVMVLAMLGDFITGTVPKKGKIKTLLPPMDAILETQRIIMDGINFLLKESSYKLIIPCCVGNHGRITDDQLSDNMCGYNLEYLMYNTLKLFYNKSKYSKRVCFKIAQGYHKLLYLFDGKYIIRLHHGEGIKYQGGVGRIYIPAFRKLDNWNRGTKVNLDIFGHHHRLVDADDFVCNGSIIGDTPYGINFDPQTAKQAFIMINGNRMTKTGMFPIFVEEK